MQLILSKFFLGQSPCGLLLSRGRTNRKLGTNVIGIVLSADKSIVAGARLYQLRPVVKGLETVFHEVNNDGP